MYGFYVRIYENPYMKSCTDCTDFWQNINCEPCISVSHLSTQFLLSNVLYVGLEGTIPLVFPSYVPWFILTIALYLGQEAKIPLVFPSYGPWFVLTNVLYLGLEGTIPLVFPSYVPSDAVLFVTSLLQVKFSKNKLSPLNYLVSTHNTSKTSFYSNIFWLIFHIL